MSLNTDNIPYEEDRVLISDAINLCSQGFFRASYIMAWLGCVESLKRRCIEIAKKDCEAQKAVKKMTQAESQHMSIDLLLIESAKNLNLIDDIGVEKLKYFFMMRSVCSHPYQYTPNKLDCEHIISSIIELVLSQPILLKKGPLSSILNKFTTEESLLNDDAKEISDYVSDLKGRADPLCIVYIWEKLLKVLDAFPVENIGSKLYNRCNIALQTLIRIAGFSTLFENNENLKNFIIEHKRSAAWIMCPIDVYSDMQDDVKAVFFRVLLEMKYNTILSYYYDNNVISVNQIEPLKTYVQSLSNNDKCYYSAKLTINFVIEQLKIHDWYNYQNPVFTIINSEKFFSSLNGCTSEQRIILGRNILQAADGSAHEAEAFICNFKTNYLKYGIDVARGVVFECFFNEQNQLRQKTHCFSDVENIMQCMPAADSSAILNELRSQIPQCTLKYKNDTFSINATSPFCSLIPLLP